MLRFFSGIICLAVLLPACTREAPVFVMEKSCSIEETKLQVSWQFQEESFADCYFPVDFKELNFASVKAKGSFPRTGPGGQFDLLEHPLLLNETLLITAKQGNWLAVSDLNFANQGWIHHKRVQQINPKLLLEKHNEQRVIIPLERLEFAFPWKQLVTRDSLKIPRGMKMPVISERKNHVIVWNTKFNRTHTIARRWLK